MYANTYENDQIRQQSDLQLLSSISKAINGEYTAIACYDHLARIAPSQKEKNIITEIRKDEVRHFQTFTSIYTWLTNRQPIPEITESCPQEYLPGLTFAIEDEQETVDFYLDISERAQHPYIKEQFRRAAADEQNHAVWFLYIFVRRK